jgi:hypothetical protein
MTHLIIIIIFSRLLLETLSKKSPSNEPIQPIKQISPDSDQPSTDKPDTIPDVSSIPLQKYVVFLLLIMIF